MRDEIEIKNAMIEKAILSTDDRGFLDCWLFLDYGGMSQGFGGYTLYLPKSFTHHNILSFAGHHIFRCMEIGAAGKFHELAGKTIRVRTKNGLIEAIGHIVKDDWYCPADDFKSAKQ